MADEIKDYANEVLIKINQSTLTAAEATQLPDVFDKSLIFEALTKVINSRGATGNGYKKLEAAALLEGVEIGVKQKKKSDILIGLVVE